MPTLHLDLSPELDSFIATRIQNGPYKNATEVVEAALAVLEREEHEDEEQTSLLIKAVDEGEASGPAEGDVFFRVQEARRLRRQHPVAIC